MNYLNQSNELKQIDINNVDINSLKDIKDISIDKNLSVEERMKEFVRQIGNPYCFKCGSIVVQVCHKDTEKNINDCMKEYIQTLGQTHCN